MAVLIHSSLVRAPLETLHAFHLDPRNLEAIQPPGFHVVRLDLPDEFVPGAEIGLRTSCLGLRQEWRVRLEEITPPHGEPARARLVDRALRSPFRYFRHRHEYVQEPRGTRLTDVVDFDPPLGGLLGWLLLPGVWITLKALFTYRHLATRWKLETPA